MKARIWKDRGTGRWCYAATGRCAGSGGYEASWPAALSAALGGLRRNESRARRPLLHDIELLSMQARRRP